MVQNTANFCENRDDKILQMKTLHCK